MDTKESKSTDLSDALRDEFDRTFGRLNGVGVTTKQAIVEFSTFVGEQVSWIVQTIRHDNVDTVFLQCHSATRNIRIVIPPKVSKAIAKQSAAAAKVDASRRAKRQAEERRAGGLTAVGGGKMSA